jgi:UDPglucose 6-dehydrogenase
MGARTPMNVTVLGLWHLGCVTAACCAKHFRVTGLDFDAANVAKLNEGHPPLFEPGLDDLIAAGVAGKSLSFTTDAQAACAAADVLWLCCDTPVDDQDVSNVEFVLENLRRALPHLPPGALVLVSSQLPVGTCRALEKEFPQFHFACSPENLRLGKAIEAFKKAARVVVGARDEAKKTLLQELFAPFTPSILFMRTESAEMVKHALNSFLALSITFINEVARLCEHTGADAAEVAAGLQSEPRIGPRAYLGPGGPFAGGTLARDGLGGLNGKTVAVLGLTYTANTDTLRRSAAVELCQKLLAAGATVSASDPAVKSLPPELSAISLASNVAESLNHADAAAVCTEWPQFRQADWPAIIPTMRQRVFVDANRFLEKELKSLPGVEHLSVGRAT